MTDVREIPTADLTLADVPDAGDGLDAIIRFAHTYNAYQAAGSFDACARIANERRHETLDQLRACLFFECRRWRHFGDDPKGDDLEYFRELVRLIRRKLEERERRERILERLKNLKRPRFGDKDLWQGCEEVEIATAAGFQIVSVQDGTPPSRLRAGELAMLVDDPTPWDELELEELEEWVEKLNIKLGAGRRSKRSSATR